MRRQPPPDAPRPLSDERLRLAIADAVAAEARARGPQPGEHGRVAPPDAAREAELAARLREVCRAAHDARIPVERVIVLLKEVWTHGTDEHLRVRASDPRLAALVSACIATYYGDP